MQATKTQKKQIAILTRGDRDLKKEMVQAITGGSKASTNDLSFEQANDLIKQLGAVPMAEENWAFFDKNSASHKYILSLCIQYGWSNPHPSQGRVANLQKLSQWLKSEKSPVRKKLMDMTAPELSRIITALENMVYKKY